MTKDDRKLGPLLAAVILLVGAVEVSALTVGRVRGAAIVGQPLQVAVPVQYAADEDIGAACFAAEVWYGESRLDAAATSVTLEPAAQGLAGTVRIRASVPVSEPIVQISLVSGCKDKTTRRYTLLADALTEPLSDGPVGAGRVSGASASQAAQIAQVAAVSAPAATTSTPASTQTPTQPVKRADAGASKAPRSSKTSAAKTAPGDGARLTLSPSEGKVPKATSGRSSTASAQQAAQLDALQKRVEVVEDWKAQQSNPDGSAREDARIKALEADLKGLQTVTAKNQQNLQTLAQAVEQVQSRQEDNSLTYLLGLVLAACVAGLGFVMLKLRAGAQAVTPWWRVGGGGGTGGAGGAGAKGVSAAKAASNPARTEFGAGAVAKSAVPVAAPQAQAKPQGRVDAMPLKAAGADAQSTRSAAAGAVPAAKSAPQPSGADDGDASDYTGIDLDLGQALGEEDAKKAGRASAQASSAPERQDRRDFQPSGSASLRAINTREMLDVRQQAEFFMALGQHEDAIKLLEGSIHDSADSNPLVYLDLLRVLHTLGRREDFDRYRAEFNHIFTGRVPDYKSFQQEGHSLESYEAICEQIAELWPSEDAVDYIEQCMVRTAEDGVDDGFDMEAFRDLLMLHGMLRRMAEGIDSGVVPFSASRLGTASHTAAEPHPSRPSMVAHSAAPAPKGGDALPSASASVVSAADALSSLKAEAVSTEAPAVMSVDFDPIEVPDLTEPPAMSSNPADAHQGNLVDFDVAEPASGAVSGMSSKSADPFAPKGDLKDAAMDLELELDLDLGSDETGSDASQGDQKKSDNLIDFDLSDGLGSPGNDGKKA